MPRPVPSPSSPGDEPLTVPDRPNRAARRGRATGTAPSHGGDAAPHARGQQGRRVNPVRRTG